VAWFDQVETFRRIADSLRAAQGAAVWVKKLKRLRIRASVGPLIASVNGRQGGAQTGAEHSHPRSDGWRGRLAGPGHDPACAAIAICGDSLKRGALATSADGASTRRDSIRDV
jgi:hypothetical protein